MGDIYQITQSTITRQQTTIDSLRAVISAERTSTSSAPSIASEIRILFPDIREIAVTTTTFAHPSDSLATDTANLALVHVSGRFHNEERERLAAYIQARLHLGKVHVVTVPSSDTRK